jgi:inorganic triphosphatase YgiF
MELCSARQESRELKLEMTPVSAQAQKVPLLQSLKAPAKRRTEVSVYFDTNKHRLHKHGLILRVRRVGNRHVQTIKANGNATPFERNEWEAELATKQPDLTLAGDTLAPLVDKKLQHQRRAPETLILRCRDQSS